MSARVTGCHSDSQRVTGPAVGRPKKGGDTYCFAEIDLVDGELLPAALALPGGVSVQISAAAVSITLRRRGARVRPWNWGP